MSKKVQRKRLCTAHLDAFVTLKALKTTPSKVIVLPADQNTCERCHGSGCHECDGHGCYDPCDVCGPIEDFHCGCACCNSECDCDREDLGFWPHPRG